MTSYIFLTFSLRKFAQTKRQEDVIDSSLRT